MNKIPLIPEINLDNAQVGDVVHSILDEASFQAQRSSNWVLMDGRDVTGSAYATLTGNTTLPDGRGQFLRGKNNGRVDGQENPDGDVALGTQQADEFASHDHGIRTGIISGVNTHVSRDGGGSQNDINTAILNEGGNETRPKNITVNIFVKIN